MTLIISDLLHNICEPYVDDLVVFSKERTDHIENLRKVFERLRKHQLRLGSRCDFIPFYFSFIYTGTIEFIRYRFLSRKRVFSSLILLTIFYRRPFFCPIKNDFIISESAIQYRWIYTRSICLASCHFAIQFGILERSILVFYLHFPLKAEECLISYN